MGLDKEECQDIATEVFLSNPRRYSLSPSKIREATSASKSYSVSQNMESISEEDTKNIGEATEFLKQSLRIEQEVAEALATESYLSGAEICIKDLQEESSSVAVDDSMSYFGASLTKMFELPSEYDSERFDMDLVNNYAQDLEKHGGISVDLAYGVALDTFISNPAEFRRRFQKKSAIKKVADKKVKKMISSDAYVGASLVNLFRLPANFSGGDVELNDIDLVNAYSEDLIINGGISDAIAYGLALDTFIADPVGFRKLFGCQATGENIDVESLIENQSIADSPEVTTPQKMLFNKTPSSKSMKQGHHKHFSDDDCISAFEVAELALSKNIITDTFKGDSENNVKKENSKRTRVTKEPTANILNNSTRSTRAKKELVPTVVDEVVIVKPKRNQKPVKVEPSDINLAADEEIALVILCDGYMITYMFSIII
jgi:hypothetical protein